MKTCTQCGKQYSDDLTACPQDGAALTHDPVAVAGQPPSTTLALTSIVLGVLSCTMCGLLAGIPAIICGHVAFGRSKKLPAKYGGGPLAIAGFVMGYLSVFVSIFLVAVLAGLLLPALSKAKSKAQEINCKNNLKQIGLANMLWADSHNGVLPQSFLDMTNELGNPAILVCPADPNHTRPAPGAPFVWSTNNITYQLLRPGATLDSVKGQVIVRCPIHGIELMADGSVHSPPPGSRGRQP